MLDAQLATIVVRVCRTTSPVLLGFGNSECIGRIDSLTSSYWSITVYATNTQQHKGIVFMVQSATAIDVRRLCCLGSGTASVLPRRLLLRTPLELIWPRGPLPLGLLSRS